jgi:hypothetical protein
MTRKNFRQIGGAGSPEEVPPPSRLTKSVPGRPRVVPSIPSKYTVHERPFTGLHEKAFGSRASRFASSTNPLPGPGYYHRPQDLLWRSVSLHGGDDTSRGISKKGFGVGFASRDDRFKPTAAERSRNGPGPGSYNVDGALVWLGRTLPSGKPEHGSNWGKDRRFSSMGSGRSGAGGSEGPGPGWYDVDRAYRPRREYRPKKGTSSFRSATVRDSVYKSLLQKRGPAPGAYNPDNLSWHGKGSSGKGGTSAFKSASIRNKLLIPNNPGPGQYNTAPPSIDRARRDVSSSTKGSSAFANTRTDRWGVPYVRKSRVHDASATPGPGAYTAALVRPMKKEAATSSWAVSASQRGGEPSLRGKRPPGPCYYKPALPPKGQSFHLNAGKRWV